MTDHQQRKRLILVAVGAVAISSLMAGPASAAPPDGFIGRAPRTAQDVERMEVIYRGRSYTWAQIYDLQDATHPMFTVEEPVSYGQGRAYAFDSEAEVRAWTCAHVAGLAQRPVCRAVSGDRAASGGRAANG
ncbi:hypothetical protein GCM10022223_45800 [Kineosporia mesophila]|uniref:Secreted protein n=1 Tax=Kineosporia mesophila TaxID=566012 RepID=A0ABP7A2J6_9ACTN|nr:hypothetical protein [Kineosporia mesophila]MCD5348995.1 hypothetical protein [Kineosporia mesophila]